MKSPPPLPMQTHWFPVDIRRRGTPTWDSTVGGWGWRSLWLRGQGLSILQKAYGDLEVLRRGARGLGDLRRRFRPGDLLMLRLFLCRDLSLDLSLRRSLGAEGGWTGGEI